MGDSSDVSVKANKTSSDRGGPASSGGVADLVGNRSSQNSSSTPKKGTMLYISNLDHDVSSDDVKNRFSKVGVLKRYAVHYDRSGRSKGTAEVVFSRRRDAAAAFKKYNNGKLNGKRMEIEIVGGNTLGPRSVSSDSVLMECPTHRGKNLQLIEHKKTYHCDGCDMKGKGQGYRCRKCDYVLHSRCWDPTDHIVPSFFEGDLFKFRKKPIPTEKLTEKRFCDACGIVISGFNYHCFKTDYDLHPCCATLKSHLDVNGQRLILNKKGGGKECDLCDSKSVTEDNKIDPGWFYASKDQYYKYHVYCIMKKATQSSSTNSGMDLAELENLPVVKKRKGGKGGTKYWKMLKAVVKYVIAVVSGDPFSLTKLFVEGVLYLGDTIS